MFVLITIIESGCIIRRIAPREGHVLTSLSSSPRSNREIKKGIILSRTHVKILYRIEIIFNYQLAILIIIMNSSKTCSVDYIGSSGSHLMEFCQSCIIIINLKATINYYNRKTFISKSLCFIIITICSFLK